jgi:hypothetical protein
MLINLSFLHVVNKGLSWNKARLKCFSQMVKGVIKNRSVNLTLLATSMTEGTSKQSEYRKAQRFFEKFQMPLLELGTFIVSQLPRYKRGWVLSIDRTNWKFGKTHINILTVGVIVKGVAIPIVWKVLPPTTKQGNSNTPQRIEIMEKVLKLITAKEIDVLTMDREFIGKKWLKWLDERGVGFVVRIKRSHQVNGIPAHRYYSSRSFKNKGLVDIWGLKLFFGGKAIHQGRSSHLYVISNKFPGGQALKLYKQRWGIEQLFSHLKKRGFNLEDTHLQTAEKLERLFGVVTMSFLLTFGWGIILQERTNLSAHEKRKSIFRLGLESLLELFNAQPLPNLQIHEPQLEKANRLEISGIIVV